MFLITKLIVPYGFRAGPHGIATPGEVKGYWELHKRFGSLPWKELIEPSIELCEEGFILTKHMADTLEPHLLNDTYFKWVLIK